MKFGYFAKVAIIKYLKFVGDLVCENFEKFDMFAHIQSSACNPEKLYRSGYSVCTILSNSQTAQNYVFGYPESSAASTLPFCG